MDFDNSSICILQTHVNNVVQEKTYIFNPSHFYHVIWAVHLQIESLLEAYLLLEGWQMF
jgi:hypothetical protein